jgi:hypothetical protein
VEQLRRGRKDPNNGPHKRADAAQGCVQHILFD